MRSSRPCVTDPPTAIEARRAAVIARRHEGGTTTPMDFITLAARLGYDIEIVEFRPFRTYSTCTDYLNSDGAAWAHCWLVDIRNTDPVIYNMTCSSACTAFIREWVQGDLECIFERIKPAHTQIIWTYSTPSPLYWDRALGGSTWDGGASLWDGMTYPRE